MAMLRSGTHPVMFGTAAGPAMLPERAVAPQAVVVNGRIYLFE
jgi:hypothetical protein